MKKLSIVLSLLFLFGICGKSNGVNPALNSFNTNAFIKNNSEGGKTASEQIRLNLYAFQLDGGTYVLDGTLTKYAPDFSNAVDRYDSRKLYNPGENVSIINGAYNLIIESRKTISESDTINFRIWNLQKKSYRLEFITTNLDRPGLSGFLVDNYLHTSTAINLNDTTRIAITVNNDAASYAQNRFKVIFKASERLLPVGEGFTFLKAISDNKQVTMQWNTIGNNTITDYYIERSQDSVNYVVVAGIHAQSSGKSYYMLDRFPVQGNNYYRIRSVNSHGITAFSNRVEVEVINPKEVTSHDHKANSIGISLFPNPAKAGNINIKISGQQVGLYQVRLVNSFGEEFSRQSFNYEGGNLIQRMPVANRVPAGIYYLQISMPQGKSKVITVVF